RIQKATPTRCGARRRRDAVPIEQVRASDMTRSSDGSVSATPEGRACGPSAGGEGNPRTSAVVRGARPTIVESRGFFGDQERGAAGGAARPQRSVSEARVPVGGGLRR